MSSGKDLDFVASDDVHETERKSRKDVALGTTFLARPRARASGRSIDSVS